MTSYDQRGQHVGGQLNADSIGTVNFHFAKDENHRYLGIQALQARLYPEAEARFRKAIELGDADGDLRYYLALAMLAGRTPRTVDGPTIRSIEEQLQAAVRAAGARPHAYALWAVIREDHYAGQGRAYDPPTPHELMASAHEADVRHIMEIVTLVEATESAVWRALVERVGVAPLPQSGRNREPRGRNTERAKLMRKYFKPVPEPLDASTDQALMLGGGGGAVIGLVTLIAASGGGAFLGFVLLVAGAIVGVKAAGRYLEKKKEFDAAWEASHPRPTDEQVAQWFDEDKAFVAQHAHQRLNISGLRLVTRLVPLYGQDVNSEIQVGGDGIVRFSRYRAVLVAMTESHLSACLCTWDFITGELLEDKTYEYYYRDIVSLTTHTNHRSGNALRGDLNESSRNGRNSRRYQVTQAREFRLEVASGGGIEVVTHVNIAMEDGSEEANSQSPTIPESGEGDALKAIHAQLRLRKGER